MDVDLLETGTSDEVAELGAHWREIQEAGGVSHPMYTWEWMSTWWEVFGAGRTLCAFIASEADGPVAIAPFVRRRARMNRLFVYSRIELMGTGEDERDEVFSEYVDMPAQVGTGTAACGQLAQGVLALDGKDKWDDLVLHRVRPDSVACRAFREGAARAGFTVSQSSLGPCHFVALPRSVGEYERQLSANRRQQIRRGIRAMERMGSVQFERAATEEQALRFLSLLAEMHQERWTAQGKHGAFASERFRQFHTAFIRRTFGQGWPELWVLRLNGEPVAALYNIRYRNRISFYQSGMRLSETSDVRPGMLAHYFAIKAAIESGAEEYDFLLGESRYKLTLSNASRELVTLRVCRNSLKERVRKAACALHARLPRLPAPKPSKESR